MSALQLFIVGFALCFGGDALRRVYAVGREANDHFVAALVLGCVGFYAVSALAAPLALTPLLLYGLLTLWGFFFCIHREGPTPRWARWTLGVPSQLAFAWALWAGLLWLLRAPVALLNDAPLWWAGPINLLPLALALIGWADCYLREGELVRTRIPGQRVRIVQLSDLHVSPLMHRAELEALFKRVNALSPDVVLITGDLVMPFSEADHSYLIEALAVLDAPTFACPGNHDLPVLDTLAAELETVGVRLLVDASAILEVGRERIEIVGVNFHWRRAREELKRALAALPKVDADYRVLMAHDPRLGPWLPPRRFDLALSGHTHGGHVALNAIGLRGSVLRWLGVRDQGWFADGRHYVHRGSWSTGLPPRMGVSSQIALFVPFTFVWPEELGP